MIYSQERVKTCKPTVNHVVIRKGKPDQLPYSINENFVDILMHINSSKQIFLLIKTRHKSLLSIQYKEKSTNSSILMYSILC